MSASQAKLPNCYSNPVIRLLLILRPRESFFLPTKDLHPRGHQAQAHALSSRPRWLLLPWLRNDGVNPAPPRSRAPPSLCRWLLVLNPLHYKFFFMWIRVQGKVCAAVLMLFSLFALVRSKSLASLGPFPSLVLARACLSFGLRPISLWWFLSTTVSTTRGVH
jgi:hypothetical protein